MPDLYIIALLVIPTLVAVIALAAVALKNPAPRRAEPGEPDASLALLADIVRQNYIEAGKSQDYLHQVMLHAMKYQQTAGQFATAQMARFADNDRGKNVPVYAKPGDAPPAPVRDTPPPAAPLEPVDGDHVEVSVSVDDFDPLDPANQAGLAEEYNAYLGNPAGGNSH